MLSRPDVIRTRRSGMLWAFSALSSVGIGTAMPPSSVLKPPPIMRLRSVGVSGPQGPAERGESAKA